MELAQAASALGVKAIHGAEVDVIDEPWERPANRSVTADLRHEAPPSRHPGIHRLREDGRSDGQDCHHRCCEPVTRRREPGHAIVSVHVSSSMRKLDVDNRVEPDQIGQTHLLGWRVDATAGDTAFVRIAQEATCEAATAMLMVTISGAEEPV